MRVCVQLSGSHHCIFTEWDQTAPDRQPASRGYEPGAVCRQAGGYHGRMVLPSGDDARDEVPRAAPTAVEDASSLPATDVCRYLLVPEAGLRYGHPERAHRCLAIRPYESIAQDKQRRLCLTADHGTCPAFQAASERRLAILAESGIPLAVVETGRSRPLGRTAPLVLEAGHAPFGRSRATASASDVSGPDRPGVSSKAGAHESGRIAGMAGRRRTTDRGRHAMAGRGLVLIVVIAALAVVAARFPGPARPEGAGASQPSAFSALAKSVLASPAAPSSTPSRSAPTTPTATLAATPVATPATTPLPSAPTPTAAALQPSVGARTYRVNSGDTLSAIAARFSVSVAAIQQLNGIKDPRLLQVGQVLRIP